MADRHAALPLDELIPRLRARAGDPERRTSTRPSASTVLMHSVAAAAAIEQAMGTLASPDLPGPVDPAALATHERALGTALPPAVYRVYAEVADGGFGPGEGILALSSVAEVYRVLRTPGAMPRGRPWPEGLLPLVAMEPGWDCVDAATGAIVAWDPGDLSARAGVKEFAGSFREIFPSVEAWLTDWLGSRTQAEAQADMLARLMSPEYLALHARAEPKDRPEG